MSDGSVRLATNLGCKGAACTRDFGVEKESHNSLKSHIMGTFKFNEIPAAIPARRILAQEFCKSETYRSHSRVVAEARRLIRLELFL